MRSVWLVALAASALAGWTPRPARPVLLLRGGAAPAPARDDSPSESSPAFASGEAMFIVKRDGKSERVNFHKITTRVARLCAGNKDGRIAPLKCDPAQVAQRVVEGVYAGVTTAELDTLAAETAAYMNTEHPDYARLAARIAISNLHKQLPPSFAKAVARVQEGNPGFLSAELEAIVAEHSAAIDAALDHAQDYEFDYFGYKTLERAYLLKCDGKICERPQHMFMRVALGIHGRDLTAAFETYRHMATRRFIHASPTLFHAGTARPQLSSCFLLTVKDDSIKGIYDTLAQCADISKAAGGIGLAVHDIRASGSHIRGTQGTSNGLVPMLRVFDATARYVDQGGGKRPGAFAVYIEPSHPDIFDVLMLRRNSGKEERRARDLFYALWIPDEFMRRVEADEPWSLMCPDECPGLADVHGAAYDALYHRYEKEGRARRTVPARQLWWAILESQIETGTPYMLYKDACNAKSNQQHLGTIRCSNLCTEIVEYTAEDEVAVCNLASICLPSYCVADAGTAYPHADADAQADAGEGAALKFDHAALHEVSKVVTRNLNKIIDINAYPVKEAENSNMRHRPIGIGVQGLADAFIWMRLPFDSPAAQKLNREVFETIYHGALEASVELAEVDGPHPSFPGSPASEGKLQFDLWGVEPSDRYDWDGLRARIAATGLRNSLLLAPMPTASTAQILGNNECIEPYTSNLYVRRVKAGEFVVVNPHLMRDLSARGLWTKEVRAQLVADGGSVQAINGVPDHLKRLYRTVWEIPQRSLIDMAAGRGAFIDQSQSLNLFCAAPDYDKLTSMHFHGWKSGLKTGMYYLRTRPAASPIQFTVDAAAKKQRALDAKEEAAGKGSAFADKAGGKSEGGGEEDPGGGGGGGGGDLLSQVKAGMGTACGADVCESCSS